MSINVNNPADDFFVNLNLQTTMQLPDSRETVLHFCEALQREFSCMCSFFQRETGEYVLEGDRESGTYPWLELQPNRMTAGYFNPPSLEDAYHLHKWLLDRSVYFLGISPLDIECLDILYGFNLEYRGNRDAIVAEALLNGCPLAMFITEGANKCVEAEPSLVISLDDDCYNQAKLTIETRSNSYQVRTGQYEDEPISIYLTVRGYPAPTKALEPKAAFDRQCEAGEDLCNRIIIPQLVQPLAAAIATK